MKTDWKVVIALGLVIWVVGSSQTTLVTAVVVSGALYYISLTTKHRWIRRFCRMDTSVQDTQPTAAVGGTDSDVHTLRSHDYTVQDG
jgi:hypothetical protein